ncbi:MAG: hypothetical protein HY689_14880 [Chloroflexi bacterium]|nr:hypothetical protein [Chloroflexota bacterium]
MRTVTILALVVALIVLWVLNCSGPRPVVTEVRLIAPRSAGAPYRVAATIRNAGRGHGEVKVLFRLQDRAGTHTVQQDHRVTLAAYETTIVAAEVMAPPGDYTPEVEVSYPPD